MTICKPLGGFNDYPDDFIDLSLALKDIDQGVYLGPDTGASVDGLLSAPPAGEGLAALKRILSPEHYEYALYYYRAEIVRLTRERTFWDSKVQPLVDDIRREFEQSPP